MKRTILFPIVALAGLALAACGEAVTTAPATKPAASAPAAAPAATPAPAPAPTQVPFTATANGVTIRISDVVYDASSGNQFIQPEAGNVFVTMNVTATNNGSSEYNFNPFNFVLKDSSGVKHTVAFMGPSEMWSAVNLTKGASLQKPLSFEAVAGKPTGLVLVWTPSFFGKDYNIVLS